MYIHTHTCVSGYQEVTAVFLRFDRELSNIDTLHIISTVEQNGRIRAKPLLTVRDYCPVQPDSIPHDLRLLLNRDLTKKNSTTNLLYMGFRVPPSLAPLLYHFFVPYHPCTYVFTRTKCSI